jgi:hypothetical protein
MEFTMNIIVFCDLAPYSLVEISHVSLKVTRSYSTLTMAQQPLVGQCLLIVEASRSHSDTPHSVGLLWTSDQPDAETST